MMLRVWYVRSRRDSPSQFFKTVGPLEQSGTLVHPRIRSHTYHRLPMILLMPEEKGVEKKGE
jgi:hypothetical protein